MSKNTILLIIYKKAQIMQQNNSREFVSTRYINGSKRTAYKKVTVKLFYPAGITGLGADFNINKVCRKNRSAADNYTTEFQNKI